MLDMGQFSRNVIEFVVILIGVTILLDNTIPWLHPGSAFGLLFSGPMLGITLFVMAIIGLVIVLDQLSGDSATL